MKFYIKDLPNILTFSRIVLTPFICLFLYFDNIAMSIISFILILIGMISDYFDGYIARKYNVNSQIGKCFDPIADKILVISVLFMLTYLQKIFIFLALMIIIREFFVAGLREFVGAKSIIIHVSKLAKWKTATQMFSILILILSNVHNYIYLFGNFILFLSAILSWITAYQYFDKIKNYIYK